MASNKSKAIQLMTEYNERNQEYEKALQVIEEFKKLHPEIFDTLEGLEYEAQLLKEKRDNLNENIKDEMLNENIKLEEIGKFRFTYVAPTTKRNFDSKKFYKKYGPKTKTYQEFVKETPVSDYIKVKELVYKDELNDIEEGEE